MTEIALRYPLRLDDRGIAIATRRTGDIWADRVRVLLSTYKSERVIDSDYGTGVDEALFAGMGLGPDIIVAAIEQAIAEYLPSLTDVLVVAEPEPFTESQITVTVFFSPPNASATSVTAAVSVQSFASNG